jgi:LysR family glycine cleavage system transcriptional activator
MNWRKLPSLNSLRAFVAVADSGSYTEAGDRLNVTQAAVSQQVKSLEAWLQVPLITRSGRGIALTENGIALARGLRAGFTTILGSVEALTVANALRPVQITMSPAFAAEWMLPRIQEFQARHPDITLMLNPTVEIMELKPGGIDLAIRFLDRRTQGVEESPFLVFDTVVIGAPSLLSGQALSDPGKLMDLPWLEELGSNDVEDWFQRRGIEPDRPVAKTQMPGNLIMQAVRRGVGITHTVRDYFTQDIRSGAVVAAYPEPAFGAFYVLTAEGTVRPPVKTFLDWLKSKAGPRTTASTALADN